MKYVPHAYQERGRRFILEHKACNLWEDMGLGKTVQVLTAIDDLLCGLDIRAALVVAPIRVIENVWPDEMAKWDHLRGLRLGIMRGNARQRAKVLDSPADIYLINFENLVWLALELDKRRAAPWDMIVWDESSKMKSHSSKRFRRFRRWALQATRKVCMTGTPRPNTYLDLWSQTYLLDGGARLGEFYTHFRDRWFEYNPWSYEIRMRAGADREIMRRLRDITLVMRSEDYLSLPPVVENPVLVTMPPAARAQYAEFEKEMFIKLSRTDGLEAVNAASLSMKCRQLTSGAVYMQDDPDGPRRVVAIHDAKLDAVEDIVDEANGESVLVVYEFRHELERLRKRWPKAPWVGGGCKDGDASIRRWNEGRVRLMFVHPASVGHGINLQHGGRIMVWTSMTWSYELYAQMVKRLHRQGQSKSVMVHLLVARGTVDETVLAALRDKKTGQDELLNALKSRAKKGLARVK